MYHRALDFDTAEVLIGISLYGCRPARDQSRLPPPPPPIPPPPSSPLNISVGLNGSPGSFVSLLVSQDQVIDRYTGTQNYIDDNDVNSFTASPSILSL